MSKYKVWNGTDDILTPVGEIFTPEQWKARYPIAEKMDIVCSGGVVNGAIFAVYDAMIDMYKQQGCDFSGCKTKQEYLDRIEQFEETQNDSAGVYVEPNSRIADALEDLVVMQELNAMSV